MNSKERHEARYLRRKAKREAKALEVYGKSFDEVFSFGNMCKAGKLCCNNVRWKTSTITFENNRLSRTQKNYEAVHNGTRKFKGFQSFTTIEHGKLRFIDALSIDERQIQKCLCKFFLTEAYSRSFIYDNSASLKDKGMDFQLKRLRKQLHDHYRKYGLEGGIYQFDFKNYFGSIPHEEIKKRARAKIYDDKLYALFCQLVDDFQYMKAADRNAEYKRGIGLGSEISQIIALDYASPIDHYVKDVAGMHGYGRYEDDGYIMSNSLQELEEIKRCVTEMAEEMGLSMNQKKNVITPFKNHSFTFLKIRIKLQKNGKVTYKLSRKCVKSMRRKLKIFRSWVDEGKMTIEDVCTSYSSWRAHAKRCNSYKTLNAMDKKFAELFEVELQSRCKEFRCTLKTLSTVYGWLYIVCGEIRKEDAAWNMQHIIGSKSSQCVARSLTSRTGRLLS